MGRWLASVGIALLLALDIFLPSTDIGRRGAEARVRSDVPEARPAEGQPFPEVAFLDLQGRGVKVSDFRGTRVLLTFERSVDW